MFPRLSELSAALAKPVQEAQLNEARGPLMGYIEKWQDQNKIYSFEGERGERNLEKLIKVLGYRDLSTFLTDNSGCLEAMLNWIGSQRSPEWIDAMKDEVGPDEDEEAEED